MRIRHMVWVSGLIMLLLGAIGCGLRCPEPTPPETTLTVATGKTFTLVLEANPTTGYEWNLAETLDPARVELLDATYRSCRPVTTGSGGRSIWKFRAVDPGETTIQLGYYPPDKSRNVPAYTVTFTITVD